MFRAMFLDSEVAQNYKCGSTKQSLPYMFWPCPLLLKQMSWQDQGICYVVNFDELLNSICQEGQIDVFINVFGIDSVVTAYLDSQQMVNNDRQTK